MIIEIGGLTYRIIGVYAPPESADRINFIQKLHTVVIDNYDAETILGGDQNLTTRWPPVINSFADYFG